MKNAAPMSGPQKLTGRRRSAPSSPRTRTAAGSSRSDTPTAAPWRTARPPGRRSPPRSRTPATCRSRRGSPGTRAHLVLLDAAEHPAERRMHESPADRRRRAAAPRARSRTAPRWTACRASRTPSGRQTLQVEQAVLAAGHRVPFDRDEPEHLAERDRQQRVVDAAAVRDERGHSAPASAAASTAPARSSHRFGDTRSCSRPNA